jgi:hypothetical protein
VELTHDEMTRLLRAFIEGKTEILEDDALTLVTWAQEQRLGALLLEMVLDGKLTPIVDGSEVKLTLRERQGTAA